MNERDNNEVRLSGTIDRLKQINTKTGSPMVEVLLKVRRDKFRVTAFGNVAEALLSPRGSVGDQVSLTGSLVVSNWRDESTGEWRNSFSVTAWGVDLHGEKVSYQRREPQASSSPPRTNRGDERWQVQPDDPF
jgi:Single-strand binding protein family.